MFEALTRILHCYRITAEENTPPFSTLYECGCAKSQSCDGGCLFYFCRLLGTKLLWIYSPVNFGVCGARCDSIFDRSSLWVAELHTY